MGVHKLATSINNNAPRAYKPRADLNPYRGQRFAIDTSIFMYRYCAGGLDPVDAFCDQVSVLRKYNITPLYVFDGTTSKCKQPEAYKRKVLKNKRITELQDCEEHVLSVHNTTTAQCPVDFIQNVANADIILANKRRICRAYPTKENYCNVEMKLIDLGIKVYHATHDAEKMCACLTISGDADVVVTDDMDALPYGARRVLTGLFTPSMGEYILADVLDGFGFTMPMFVDFCILCGTDLCQKIRNIGNARACSLIKQHRSIECILDCLNTAKFTVPRDFMYQRARVEYGVGADSPKEPEPGAGINISIQ
jgi:flap endonuclease-1